MNEMYGIWMTSHPVWHINVMCHLVIMMMMGNCIGSSFLCFVYLDGIVSFGSQWNQFPIRLSVFIPSSSIQYSLFASSFVRKWNCTSQSVNVWHSFSSKIKSTWPEIAVKNLIKFHIMPVPLYLSFLIKFHKSEWRRVLNIFTTKSIFSNRRKNPDVIQMRCVCAVGRI